MTRRRGILRLGSCLLGGCVSRAVAAREPHIRFPVAARDRLAVASYPFREFIQNPRKPSRSLGQQTMPLTSFPAMVVQRFGVRNVELLGDHFASTEPDYVHQLRQAAEKAGVSVVNLPVGTRTSVYDPDAGKRATAVEDARKWVDVAVALNCPSIRVHIRAAPGTAPVDADSVKRASDTLRVITGYAAEKDTMVNLENDDPKSELASFIVELIELVNNPYLRALPDFCNSMLIGPEQYNYDSVKAMFAHAYNICHVKDSEVEGAKVYRVDVDRTFAIAKASGYRGYFSMEFENAGDPYEGTEKLIRMSLKNLGG